MATCVLRKPVNAKRSRSRMMRFKCPIIGASGGVTRAAAGGIRTVDVPAHCRCSVKAPKRLRATAKPDGYWIIPHHKGLCRRINLRFVQMRLPWHWVGYLENRIVPKQVHFPASLTTIMRHPNFARGGQTFAPVSRST